jgi:hypothetical protein
VLAVCCVCPQAVSKRAATTRISERRTTNPA